MPSISEAPVGSIVSFYLDDNGYITDKITNKTITATVTCLFFTNDVLSNHLIGWKDGETFPADDMMYIGPIDKSAEHGWKETTAHHYDYAPNFDDYTRSKWVYSVNCLVADIQPQDGKLYAGATIPNTSGSFRVITPADILPGDTIAWMTTNHKLNYATVRGLSEGEDHAENPLIMLDADVYCGEGQRHYPKGYPMRNDVAIQILLIKREHNG